MKRIPKVVPVAKTHPQRFVLVSGTRPAKGMVNGRVLTAPLTDAEMRAHLENVCHTDGEIQEAMSRAYHFGLEIELPLASVS